MYNIIYSLINNLVHFDLFNRYVNVNLNGIQPGYFKPGFQGSVFIENPVGENILTFSKLKEEVRIFLFKSDYYRRCNNRDMKNSCYNVNNFSYQFTD